LRLLKASLFYEKILIQMPQDLDKTLQIFIFRVLRAAYSPIWKTWRTRIVLPSCFCQGRERLYEFERFLCKSLIHSSKQTLWLSGREFKWLFDSAQKRILVNDRTRQPPKVLDSCSSSQIHLWSKCQIVRRRAILDGERSRNVWARLDVSPNVSPPSHAPVSNLKSKIDWLPHNRFVYSAHWLGDKRMRSFVLRQT
jgi:hypothetical protein